MLPCCRKDGWRLWPLKVKLLLASSDKLQRGDQRTCAVQGLAPPCRGSEGLEKYRFRGWRCVTLSEEQRVHEGDGQGCFRL